MEAIEVVVIRDGEQFIASDDVYLRYGVGQTADEAKKDYALSLLDYYKDLTEFDGRLSLQLQDDLGRLRMLKRIEWQTT